MKEKNTHLSIEQIEFACSSVKNWIEICLNNQKAISPESAENSALLRRLLSGKPALPQSPPKRFGNPAWELVEQQEVEISEFRETEGVLKIDGHDGYFWIDKSSQTISYPRLNIAFKLVEKTISPDPMCIKEGEDPSSYQYTARFLQKIEEST
jgi:hypothetical protein